MDLSLTGNKTSNLRIVRQVLRLSIEYNSEETYLEPPKMYIKFEKIYSNFSLLLRKSS